MTVSLDARQSLAEIEHALFKSFPFTSASITHVTSSDGVVTLQVSWVASAGGRSRRMQRDGGRRRIDFRGRRARAGVKRIGRRIRARVIVALHRRRAGRGTGRRRQHGHTAYGDRARGAHFRPPASARRALPLAVRNRIDRARRVERHRRRGLSAQCRLVHDSARGDRDRHRDRHHRQQ